QPGRGGGRGRGRGGAGRLQGPAGADPDDHGGDGLRPAADGDPPAPRRRDEPAAGAGGDRRPARLDGPDPVRRPGAVRTPQGASRPARPRHRPPTARRRTMNLSTTRRAGILVLGLLLASGCGSKSGRPRPSESDRLPRLETVLPERTTLRVLSDLTATVEAMEKADLCAQVRGVVKEVPAHVDIGRLVKEGEPLLTLDIP